MKRKWRGEISLVNCQLSKSTLKVIILVSIITFIYSWCFNIVIVKSKKEGESNQTQQSNQEIIVWLNWSGEAMQRDVGANSNC
jgi:flagellar basal body-associated protein FliL